MSFDIVSYILGAKSGGGGGGGSLADLDSIAFGNDPTLPSEGKTNPANYEAIADAINTAKARGNAVTVGSLSVTQNGTQTAPTGTAWNSVTVNVPGYTGYDDISGTMANPFGSLSFAEARAQIYNCFVETGALPAIEYSGDALGVADGFGVLYSLDSDVIVAMGANVGALDSIACQVEWRANGLTIAYIEQNGTITDISQYASLITTTLYLPTQGGN